MHTFLFTDLEGSTRLWEQHESLMQSVMARHDALLKQAVEANRGQVVKTTGDGLHAVFDGPNQAVRAALEGQLAIQAESWPETTGPMRVRMGLHTGESEARDGDYYGPTLNRAARIMAAGHGGQVLLSELVAAMIRDNAPASATLRDLGEHGLRDLMSPVRLYQLCHPDLPDQFPPIRSLSSYKNNLPVQLTSFVGRTQELERIRAHLLNTRLLTLLGPGGTGKTRLALQTGAEVVDQFPDGVWLIELAGLVDPDLIPGQIAGTLRVPDTPGRSLTESVADFLRLKELLLIFDNVEHMVRESAELAENLLRACPKIRILVTGREALFVGGETTLQIPSLGLPPKSGPVSVEDLMASESVKLFMARAAAALPGYELTEAKAPAVTEIVRRLDGIPLAIELAAARLRMMSVEQIAQRLSDRFRLLTGGQRTALPRQQTLQALIDWSWNLLDEDEKILFRRLSVFAGGWTLEAAEAVTGFDGLDVFYCMEQLVNKSLIVVDRSVEGEVRYRRLESIRQYSRDRLFESGEGETVRAEHAAYFLRFAEEVAPLLQTTEGIKTHRILVKELENFRAAVDWALDNQPGVALRITALLLEREGYWISGVEAESWLRKVIDKSRGLLEVEGSGVDRGDFISALIGLVSFLGRMGYTSIAVPVANEVIELTRLDQDFQRTAHALSIKFMVTAFDLGADFIDETEQALAYAREKGFEREILNLSAMLGGYYMGIGGDPEKGLRYVSEMYDLANKLGDPRSLGLIHEVRGFVSRQTGKLQEAIESFQNSHKLRLQYGDQLRANVSLSAIGHIYRQMGENRKAEAVYREALKKWQEIRHLPAIAHQLECFAFIALGDQQLEKSARLLGAADALRKKIEEPRKASVEIAEYHAAVANLEELMGPEAVSEQKIRGAEMDADDAIAFALA